MNQVTRNVHSNHATLRPKLHATDQTLNSQSTIGGKKSVVRRKQQLPEGLVKSIERLVRRHYPEDD